MHRSAGLLRQHELRASQRVSMQQSTQSLAKMQQFDSTQQNQNQRSAESTNLFVTRILEECGLEIKIADEENMNNNDELNVSRTRTEFCFSLQLNRIDFDNENG